MEQWQKVSNERAEHLEKRVDTLWDWRAEVRPALKTTNRLLWTVLTVLIGDLGFSAYVVIFPHVH